MSELHHCARFDERDPLYAGRLSFIISSFFLMLGAVTDEGRAFTPSTCHEKLRAGAATCVDQMLVINSETDSVYSGLRLSSTNGDCVQIINSTNVTIQASNIGPCGTDHSASGRGIYVSGGSGIKIYDNYIHPETLRSVCCSFHAGVDIEYGTTDVTIRGNVIAYGETNVEAYNVSNIAVVGNFLLNPRGPLPQGQNFQSWADSVATPNRNITVSNNYTISSTDTTKYLYPDNQEDSLSFGVTDTFSANGNYIVGGHSPTGSGINFDTGSSHGEARNNIILETGNSQFGAADGVGHVFDGNKALTLNPIPSAGDLGVGFSKFSNSGPCGGTSAPDWITLSNTIAAQKYPDDSWNSYWTDGTCGTINQINNTWDQAAYNILFPMAKTNPPPPIPPQPHACVAVSPYSTSRKDMPSC
jgi:hypothetical protein